VPLTTATGFSFSAIAGAGGMTPNLYKDEVLMILQGTGAGQERYILSHDAVTINVKTNFTTLPDGTSNIS